jgi:DNA-binding response OmpR family regulator
MRHSETERKTRILSVSYDPVLLHTRQMLLESHGFRVTSAEGFVDAIEKCKAAGYDLIVIGHSIPHKDKLAMMRETEAHCPVPVVALLRINEPSLEGAADADPYNPADVIGTIRRLLESS